MHKTHKELQESCCPGTPTPVGSGSGVVHSLIAATRKLQLSLRVGAVRLMSYSNTSSMDSKSKDGGGQGVCSASVGMFAGVDFCQILSSKPKIHTSRVEDTSKIV